MMLLAHLYSVLEVMPIKLFNIYSCVLCGLFMWPYGIKSILPFFQYCVISGFSFLGNAALGFEKDLLLLFTRPIAYLIRISSYPRIIDRLFLDIEVATYYLFIRL